MLKKKHTFIFGYLVIATSVGLMDVSTKLKKAEVRDLRRVMSDYNLALNLDPDFAEGYITRGMSKYHSGDKRGALSDYNRAVALDPGLDTGYLLRGVVELELGNYLGAIVDINTARALDPNKSAGEHW